MKKMIFIGFMMLLAIPYAHAESLTKSIKWERNIETALATAKKTNQLLILDFYADWCPPCSKMEEITYLDSRVITHLKNYLPIKIDIDKKQELANQYDGNAKANGGSGIPAIIIVDANGRQLAKARGYLGPDELLALLKGAEDQHSK